MNRATQRDQVVTDLVHLIRHEVAKPQNTAKMFVDILDEIAKHPQDLILWKNNLIASFNALEDKLNEISILTQTELKVTSEVSLARLLDNINESTPQRVYCWSEPTDLTVHGEGALLQLFFTKFSEFAFRDGNHSLEALTPFLVQAKPAADGQSVNLEITASNQTEPNQNQLRLPNQNLAYYLCEKIVALHGGTFKAISNKTGGRYHITLPVTEPCRR